MSLSTECAAALLSFRYASLNIKAWYKNIRFCHGFLTLLSADHNEYNALLCGRASFSTDHNALRFEEPCFQRTRMHCALPQFETKTTTTKTRTTFAKADFRRKIRGKVGKHTFLAENYALNTELWFTKTGSDILASKSAIYINILN